MSPRPLTALTLVALVVAGVAAVVNSGRLPPADFTFNNDTEIESFDPAVVTGQPEGRIIESIYEGLVKLGPKDRAPIPGVAERWEVSGDGLTYTFHLRKDAVWTNGEPVTAHDLVYSMRRFLDPLTLAEYAYQGWYLKNGRRYSRATRGVEVGDRVEVELHAPPKGALPYARGEVVRGLLRAVETEPGATAEALADAERFTALRTFVVETAAGATRRFRVGDEGDAPAGAESCRQLMLDFAEVGFRALDDGTVQTTLESPTPYWLQLLGFYPLSPVNRTCVETHGPKWTRVENLVTNGPYRVAFHRLRDRIRLEKFADYWDADKVAIATIDALAVNSSTTSFNLYETGQVDWITKVSPLIARELRKADPPRQDFNPDTQLAVYFYIVNTRRKPLDDRRVRRALALALDREEVIATSGVGEPPALSMTPPGLPGYDPPRLPAGDLAEARRLLAEAGFDDGAGFPKIEILYNTEEQHQTIAELVRKQWQRGLGINVSTRNEEWATLQSSQRQLRFDVSRRSWVGDYLDPITFLDLFVTGGENNNTGWGSERYDALVHGAKRELDAAKRLAMLREAETILMDELPVLPIYFYVSRLLVKPHVRGFYNNLQDTHPLWALRIDRESPGPNEFMTTPGTLRKRE